MLNKLKRIFDYDSGEKLDKFEVFLGLVDNYLRREHPKINFHFSNYENVEEDENLKIKKTLVIRDIVKQFVEFKWEKTTQKSIKKELLWSGYGLNSSPSPKIPIDFTRRKEIVFIRDLGICSRCGKSMEKIQQCYTVLAQDSSDNGGYNIENIILLCSNCHNVLKNEDKAFSEIPLKLRDDLYDFV